MAALTDLTSLNLSGNGIGAEGAHALVALTKLASLNLADNGIGAEGAHALAALTNLTSLNLVDNVIWPGGARALAALTNLTSLDLARNRIGTEDARALAALINLTSLNLADGSIGAEGARALASLTNLTSLNLWGNGIGAEGAQALAALTSLTSLNLWDNSIGAEGARALAALTNLTSLDLTGNRIGVEGARALATLINLTSLNLADNSIGAEGARALLDAWIEAPSADRLQCLDLAENDDLSSVLPAEVLHTTDAQAILAAYRRFRVAAKQDTLRPLNEAKLLVVGNEAVGKTSLIRYLVNNEARDPNEPKTPGAAIHEKIQTQTWTPEGSPVTLNIWDFGGQEIMHGTHRFFLTERSLYLLVLENRREDDRSIYDWLKVTRNRGGGSPIIVVINKCDDERSNLRLDETGLRQDHPAIVGFVRTSCNPDEAAAASIAGLRQLIATQLIGNEQLRHVRDPIPLPWLRVKEAVTALSRQQRVLTSRELERLCESVGEEGGEVITNLDEQRALLRLLHDLGVVVAHGPAPGCPRGAPAGDPARPELADGGDLHTAQQPDRSRSGWRVRPRPTWHAD